MDKLSEGAFFESEESLKAVDLGQLADWIDEYNTNFGPFARQIRAGLMMTEEEREKREIEIGDDKEPVEREEEKAGAAQAEILKRNEALAEEVGLSLDFPSGDEKQEWAPELRVDIVDGEKFAKYLEAQTRNNPSESQLRGLKKIAQILNKQLTNGYDLKSGADARLLELVGSMSKIVPLYERLGKKNESLSEETSNLEDLYESVRGKYLLEYIKVKEARLLIPVGQAGFGPAAWHTDMTEENYRETWTEALATLEGIKKNPNAKEFRERVRTHLLASLEAAEKDMKKRENRAWYDEIQEFIKATKEKLQ